MSGRSFEDVKKVSGGFVVDSVLEGMLNAESEKHQEPRNQVPEEGSGSEEGLFYKSCKTQNPSL